MERFARNRRVLLGLAAGLLVAQIPEFISKSVLNKTTKFDSNSKNDVVALLKIQFPVGYDLAKYEYEVPMWAKNDSVREYVRGHFARGGLKKFDRTNHSNGIDYRFTFANEAALRDFMKGVEESGLVDRTQRAQRGLVAKLVIGDKEYAC